MPNVSVTCAQCATTFKKWGSLLKKKPAALRFCCHACQQTYNRKAGEQRRLARIERGAKTCTRCGAEKPLPEFPKDARRADGHFSWCFPCSREDKATRRKARQDFQSFLDHKYTIKYKYGMSPDDYAALFRAQSGACAICGRHPKSDKKARLSVDHCHETNKVRGLLCHHCNVGLGLFRDSAYLLRVAAVYVFNHKTLAEEPAAQGAQLSMVSAG